VVPRAENRIRFTVEGPGEIVATDNGDPTSFEPFPSPERKAFSGLVLAIVRAKTSQPGRIRLTATSQGLATATAVVATAAPR
jgi:beta-galactosidase